MYFFTFCDAKIFIVYELSNNCVRYRLMELDFKFSTLQNLNIVKKHIKSFANWGNMVLDHFGEGRVADIKMMKGHLA